MKRYMENHNKDMAYYCTLCKRYHYPGSEIWWAHRIYASVKHKLKKIVRRKSPPRDWRW